MISPVGGADMSYVEHLTELRKRLIISLAALLVGTVIGFLFMDTLIPWLTAPVGQLYIIRPAGFLLVYCKIALFCGMLLSSPILLYEIWAFLLPAFTPKSRRWIWICLPLSLLLALSGMGFSYFLVLPKSLQFLLSLGSAYMQPMISVENYLDFMMLLVLPFGVIFNVPLLSVLLLKAGVVRWEPLKKARRYVIFISFLLAAIITPTPDVINQCLVACPMVISYEIGLLLGRIVARD